MKALHSFELMCLYGFFLVFKLANLNSDWLVLMKEKGDLRSLLAEPGEQCATKISMIGVDECCAPSLASQGKVNKKCTILYLSVVQLISQYVEYGNAPIDDDSDGMPIHFDELRCPPGSHTFSQCTHGAFREHNCGHHQDVYLTCGGEYTVLNWMNHCQIHEA